MESTFSGQHKYSLASSHWSSPSRPFLHHLCVSGPVPGWEALPRLSDPLSICVAQHQTQHLAHSSVSAMILEFKAKVSGLKSGESCAPTPALTLMPVNSVPPPLVPFKLELRGRESEGLTIAAPGLL